MKSPLIQPILGLALLAAACVPASDHARDVAAGRQEQDRMTLGTVQREIRIGMTAADVIAVLGAPNIVTTEERRRETWVYDKMASERVYSASTGGVNVLFLGGATSQAGASQTTQRTLTVIVKFDEAGKVRDFSYRSSSF